MISIYEICKVTQKVLLELSLIGHLVNKIGNDIDKIVIKGKSHH